jgi:Asp-tRNA(Asn)/Glu-tRNA(Gln) amidotransferase A subunit family amidase
VTLEPFTLPDLPTDLAGVGSGAESGAFFDEFLRSGRDALLGSERRGNGYRRSRLIPAVEFLQSQRARALVMRRFADVVSRFDVYITPYMQPRPPRDEDAPAPVTPPPPPPPSAIRDHFGVANLCGYPGVSVPNGFDDQGRPTGITFMGRLYNEAQILAMARAYQNAARWHERTPKLQV